MERCILCNEPTNEQVYDNIGEKSYLCSYCKRCFEQCEICNEYFLGEDLAEHGICENCYENSI